ncbi:MAG: GTPase ObgE [Dehalococcoidales bacterium]
MFDNAEIRVKAGNGGNGAIGFRREKYIPLGGPDGGNGGRGGNVVIHATDNMDSLRRYRQRRLHSAEDGGKGSGSNKHGKDGEDLVISVPAGTIVSAEQDGTLALIADLQKQGDEAVVARGGRGGLGNRHYVSSTNQSPRIAQRGEEGEEKSIRLEMRLIADAGIIGYPNAGKSTLLAAASAAKPKIASYPFTTLEPVLGVVEIGLESFVLAEIPGLIEGAHLGRGLGHDFLRHAMRTKVLIHLISGESASPVKDIMTLNNELALFDTGLAQKPQIVVLNKIDLDEVKQRRGAIEEEFEDAGIKAHYLSAATGRGVSALMKETLKVLKSIAGAEVEKKPLKVFRPQPRESGVKVTRQGEEFVISAPGLERIMGGVGVTDNELRWQLNYLLKKMGVNSVLEKMGAQPGDKIRCGDMTWEW